MPRRKRRSQGGYVYHVLNRSVRRATLFAHERDYQAFQLVMEEARRIVPIRLLSYCLMPNHWHLALWPREDDELSGYMHWLTLTHTQRWHALHGTSGTGPIYQGRFKSFPVEEDEHFYSVCRYVERNPLRAALVEKAQNWKWSSLWSRTNDCYSVSLDRWPLPLNAGWCEYVNQIVTEAELAAIRESVQRGKPYGSEAWCERTAKLFGLESTLHRRGRPSKTHSWGW